MQPNHHSETSQPLSMQSIVTSRMSREEINALPIKKWQGPTHLISCKEQIEHVMPLLEQTPVLGFDTETRPAFRKGQQYLPSLLQLATDKEVFLFQLKQIGLPDSIAEVLSNWKIAKVGVAITDDVQGLQKLAPFSPAGFIELAKLGKTHNIQHFGLRGLAAATMGIRITKSKKISTSNWAQKKLSPGQLQYAATDAWIGREIFLRLSNKTRISREHFITSV